MKNWKLSILKYKHFLNSFAHIVKSVGDYAITRSPLSFIGGVYSSLEHLFDLKSYSPYDVFNTSHDWQLLHTNKSLVEMFQTVFNSLPSENLEFDHYATKLIKADDMECVYIQDRYDNHFDIFIEKKSASSLLKFLADKKMEEMNSNYIYLTEPDAEVNKVQLDKFDPVFYPSERANELIKELENAFSKDIKRSLCFIGAPGVGKTTLAYSILDHFNFRTLKFRPLKFFNLSLILTIIDLFKIESVILDDMDRFTIDDQFLEFIAAANKKTKLVIGICNSTKELDPALLRPGRFDDLIKIEGLDDATIQKVLGDLYEQFKEKVVGWPIAYVQELQRQSILNPDKLDAKYDDLKKRVEALLDHYEDEDEDGDEFEDEEIIEEGE